MPLETYILLYFPWSSLYNLHRNPIWIQLTFMKLEPLSFSHVKHGLLRESIPYVREDLQVDKRSSFHDPWKERRFQCSMDFLSSGCRICCLRLSQPPFQFWSKSRRIAPCWSIRANFTQSYSFILNLVGNNVNIAWMILCATYIRFRRACKTYKITGVKEAEHPLQPFLAYWGLFWSGFTGFLSSAWPIWRTL